MAQNPAKILIGVDDAIRAVLWDKYGIALNTEGPELGIAAVRAMREPTKKMRDAAAKAMSPEHRPTQARVSVSAKHAIRYRAMIDAALASAVWDEKVRKPEPSNV